MAIFYMRTKVIGRSSKGGGRSAVQADAYQGRSKVKDVETGKTYDYTARDEDLVHAEVSLPDNWPREYLDSGTLWNAVEKKENKSNSRLARQFLFAIPKEMTDPLEQIEFCRSFVKETFPDVAVSWAIHDKHDGNPHMHALMCLRTCRSDGTWASKEKKAYRLDNEGNRIPVLAEDGTQKVDSHGRRQWQRITVSVNDWENLSCHSIEKWRESWEKACNDWLIPHEIDPVDHRSYYRQEFEKWQDDRVTAGQDPGTETDFKKDIQSGTVYVPKGMIHEGYRSRRQDASYVCDHNREVRVERSIMDWLRDRIENLGTGIEKLSHSIERIVAKIKEVRVEALSSLFGKEDNADVFERAEVKTGISVGSGNDISTDEGDHWRDAVAGAEAYLDRAEAAGTVQRDSEFEQDTEAGSKRESAVGAGEIGLGAANEEPDPVDRFEAAGDYEEARVDAGL